uniref:Hexosyltransferase n=1 Tax=Panagrolaimus sp. ES5 TaxID=591445 RepID=A0AC34F7J4_9BILA
MDVSGPWKVNVRKVPVARVSNDPSTDSKQVVRSRFAATELGIREKIMVIVLGQSSLSVALNSSIGKFVPKMHLFIEESRIDIDISTLADNLSPYHPNGQHAHVHILNTIFNKSFYENYDWFLFVPDTTYINPFRLMEFVNHRNFYDFKAYGITQESERCYFAAGILLSSPVVRSLIQQRHVCASIVASSDEKAFETCIHRATNVTCTQDEAFQWWRTDDHSEEGLAIHDRINWFSSAHGFNQSITVSKLLSDADVSALHNHFLEVERERLNEEINEITVQLDDIAKVIPQASTWPKGLPPVSKPPNRYQVPFWEYFTETEIFKIESHQNVHPLVGNDALDVHEIVPFWEYFTETEIFKIENHQNVHPLVGNDALDVREIVTSARQLIEKNNPGMEFVRLRNGYRLFNAMRGMEYIVDLEYHTTSDSIMTKRAHLCRPIQHSQLVPNVPYVKEDTDITLVIPVGSPEDVVPARSLLVRHLRLCKSSLSQIDSRRTRLVIAVRGISALNVRQLSNDLIELKKRCKSMQTETALLLLKPNVELMVQIAAMDEAIDHYGQQTVYVLLSPYADYQREFLDRIRINSIRHFQVFIPIPFAEFSPKIIESDHLLSSQSNNSTKIFSETLGDRIHRLSKEPTTLSDFTRPIVVHKNNGLFDTNDFSSISMYGVDYVNMRPRLLQKLIDGELVLDLSTMFMGQTDIHVLRAIEPSLKLRYHLRSCPSVLTNMDFARCSASQKQTIGSKAQLANIVFNDLEDLSIFEK